MVDFFLLIAIVLIAYLSGKRVTNTIIIYWHHYSEKIVISISLGLGMMALLMFILGILGLYYNYLLISLVCISLVGLSIPEIKHKKYHFYRRIRKWSCKENIIFSLILLVFTVYVLFNLICCMTPVINGDSIAAYLVPSKLYIENHRIYNIDWVLWGHVPQYIQMLNTMGLLLSSDILSQLITGWLMGLMASSAVYVLAREFVNRKLALLTAIFFYTMPSLSWLIYSTKIDLGYTFFELSFWILFIKWIKTRSRQFLYVSAVFLGLAIGSKYHSLIALFFATCVTFLLLLINKKKFSYIIMTLTIFSVIALAIGSPSYIKNFIYTNDPVYPFITNPDIGSGENINQYSGILDYFRFQYNMIFGKNIIIKDWRMMDNPIGFLPVLFIPFLLFFRKINQRNKVVLLILGSYYLFLSFIIFRSVFPYPRHYLPAIGLLVVINSVGMKEAFRLIDRKIIYGVMVIAIASIVFITHIGWGPSKFSLIKQQLNFISGKSSKIEYLRKRVFDTGGFHMNYDMIQYVDSMPEDTRIITLDYGNGYYVPRPFLKKGYLYTNRDLDSLLIDLKNDKVTHIYFNEPVMEKYVARWQDGNYSVILQGKKNGILSFEYKADEQFLYKINYNKSDK